MSLAVFQREAERVAQRLGVTDPIRLVWKRNCPKPRRWRGSTYAHCHAHGDDRGVICLRERDWYGRRLTDVQGKLQHEVAHLVVRDHRAKGYREAVALAAGKKPHQHRFHETGGVSIYHWAGQELVAVETKCRCGQTKVERHEVVSLAKMGLQRA